MGQTVTVTSHHPSVRAVKVGAHTFPIGEQVPGVPDDIVTRLQAMPGVSAQIDTPEPEAVEPPPEEDT